MKLSVLPERSDLDHTATAAHSQSVHWCVLSMRDGASANADAVTKRMPSAERDL